MNVFAAATWPHETTGGEPSVDGTFGRHNDNLASFGCRGHGINRYIYIQWNNSATTRDNPRL